MSRAAALLNDLRARGVELQADDGRLRFRPATKVPAELVTAMREHKAELLALLDPPPAVEPETHADREALRFVRAAVPWPGGWYDPGNLGDNAGRAYLAWLNEPQEPDEAPKTIGPAPTLYPRPGGGVETFTGRAARYLQECNGLPLGASRV